MARICFGELDRAETELKKAIEIAPERAAPYLNLASIALARKQPEAALPWLERSIAREDTAICRFIRGETLLQLGRVEEAAHEYQRAAELSAALPELAAQTQRRLNQLRQRGIIR
jgi:predicted negative regulator of RcsB-dependent stress response